MRKSSLKAVPIAGSPSMGSTYSRCTPEKKSDGVPTMEPQHSPANSICGLRLTAASGRGVRRGTSGAPETGDAMCECGMTRGDACGLDQ